MPARRGSPGSSSTVAPVAARFGDLASAAAALLAAVALVAAVERLPTSVRAAEALVAENAGLSRLERELGPTRSFGLNPTLVLRADELLPRDAVFHVATGQGMLSGHDAAAPFSAYWLLPRRHTDDPRRAEWILSFGADESRFGVEVDVVEDVGAGAKLLRVRR
jgi:hypothetical protein